MGSYDLILAPEVQDTSPSAGYFLQQFLAIGRSVTGVIALPNTDEFRTCDRRRLGNWKKTVFEPVGDSQTTQARQHSYRNWVTANVELQL